MDYWQDAGGVSRLVIPDEQLRQVLVAAKAFLVVCRRHDEAVMRGEWVEATCAFAAALDRYGLRDGWAARKRTWDKGDEVTMACWLLWGAASDHRPAVDKLERAIELLDSTSPAVPAAAELTQTPQLLTLDQIAALARRKKRAIENYKRSMPKPAVLGGGGKPAYWNWDDVKPWLIKTFGIQEEYLPKRFKL